MRKPKLKKLSPKYVLSKRRRILRFKNHPFIVPVVTLIILVIATGVGYIFLGSQTVGSGDSHIVIVTDGDDKKTLPTRTKTVGELLKRLEIKINSGDIVEPVQDTEIVEDNFRINIYRGQPITIVDNNKKTFVYSAATTPRSIVAQANVKVFPEDKITAQLPTDILRTGSIGQEVIIERSTQVFLVMYGTPITVRTHAKTVSELVKETGVKLDKEDKVQPAGTTSVKKDMFVVISREGTKFSIETEEIPPPTKVIEDTTLSFGTTAVRQKGSPGKSITVYQIIESGGKTSRKKVQQIVAVRPVQEIIARGKAVFIPKDKSAVMSEAGIPASDFPYINFILSRESGWCPTKLQGQIGYCPAFAPSYIPDYLGYGIGQATPGSKMSAYGSDWQTNIVTQLKWANGYATGRYGTWEAAYNFWLSNHYW